MQRKVFFLFLVLGSLALAQELRLGAGVSDFQVLQRNEKNTADLKLGGTAQNLDGKRVEVRLTANNKPVKNFGWSALTTVSGSTWIGELKNVPIGGPYTLELRVQGATPVSVRDLLVGDLWILAGQSNMEGVGDLVNVQPPDVHIHSFDMADQWMIAREPLHELPSAVDRVHWDRNLQNEPKQLNGDALSMFRQTRKKGAGLGLPFAAEMFRRTGVPIGLVPCAHGGTSMAQWDPALRDKGGDSLYGAMYRRFEAVGKKVKGVLWYQGESDANSKAAPLFPAKFENLVGAVRREFGLPDLPFYYVQIGRFINNSNVTEWNSIQEFQRLAEATIPHSGVVAAVDLALDDIIHVGTADQKRLGIRLANLAVLDLFPDTTVTGPKNRGPRPASAIYKADAVGVSGTIQVKFTQVNGKFRSDGRIGGFTIHLPGGELAPLIYKAQTDPADGATVLLHIGAKLPAGATLHYGYGKDPYCNLRDEADMAALVFGPMPIAQ